MDRKCRKEKWTKYDENTLFYDIETTPILTWNWRCGKAVIHPGQILDGYFSRYHIICIQYRWARDKKAKILTWGKSDEDERKMIDKFNKIAEKAEIIIGKNNNRFDNKHITTHQLWQDIGRSASWLHKCDDLESQMRKHLYLPSYSLDYISKQLGLGGKIKMDLDDWKDISYKRIVDLAESKSKGASKVLELFTGKNMDKVIKDGIKAENKMFKYGIKDTDDTAAIWNHCRYHLSPKYNRATASGDLRCIACGSLDIIKFGSIVRGKTVYTRFRCKSHNGEAGHAVLKSNGTYGKIGK